MPLLRGSSKEVIAENIRELMHKGGRTQAQSIAIAYRMAGKSKDVTRTKKGVSRKSHNPGIQLPKHNY